MQVQVLSLPTMDGLGNRNDVSATVNFTLARVWHNNLLVLLGQQSVTLERHGITEWRCMEYLHLCLMLQFQDS
jgi:hypothetical protein